MYDLTARQSFLSVRQWLSSVEVSSLPSGGPGGLRSCPHFLTASLASSVQVPVPGEHLGDRAHADGNETLDGGTKGTEDPGNYVVISVSAVSEWDRIEEAHRVGHQGGLPEKRVLKQSHSSVLPGSHHHLPPLLHVFSSSKGPTCAQPRGSTTAGVLGGLCHSPSQEGRLGYAVRGPGSPPSRPRQGPRVTALLCFLGNLEPRSRPARARRWLVRAVDVLTIGPPCCPPPGMQACQGPGRREPAAFLLIGPQLAHSLDSRVGWASSFLPRPPRYAPSFIPGPASRRSGVSGSEQRIEEGGHCRPHRADAEPLSAQAP